jgi:RND family efflux transporter MFP subunit
MTKRCYIYVLLTVIVAGCSEPEEIVLYQSSPVVVRDIVVAVEAAGIIEPSLTVEVKSKASGEILSMHGETGDVISQGMPLVVIDKRTPRNNLAQAEAELEAAIARRSIAAAQSARSKTLLESRTINEVDYETNILEFANAKAEVIRAEVAVENTRIALEDADVRAPMTGTVIARLVEKGQVISSPTMDVGGGTPLLTMADLSTVQVNALVDETDIGKIRPEQAVTVTVAAYPNQPFDGTVAKIEPKATEDQTVTTFSVLIILDNENGLLRPGMNADVEIRIAERRNVVAVATNALRVEADIPIASQLVGLDEATVRDAIGDALRNKDSSTDVSGYQFSNRYWVFIDRAGGPEAIVVDTGLTDLDHSEVLAGLAEGDRVLELPSSGLIRSQQRFQEQMGRFMSLPGMSKSDKGKSKGPSKGPSKGKDK